MMAFPRDFRLDNDIKPQVVKVCKSVLNRFPFGAVGYMGAVTGKFPGRVFAWICGCSSHSVR